MIPLSPTLLNVNLRSRLTRCLQLLAEADRIMRLDAEHDEGKVRSLTNDLGYLRDRMSERLKAEQQIRGGSIMSQDPRQVSIFDLLATGERQ